MLRYLVQRLFVKIPTLIAISILTFIIIQLPPGDYLSNQVAELKARGEEAGLEKLEFLREQFGFDKPMWQQYLMWVGAWPSAGEFNGLLQGNWGWSFEHSKPVEEVVGEGLFLTIILNAATVLFVYIVAFPIGIYSATRQYSWGDYGFTLLGYIGLATPNFLLGLILLYYANVWFGLSVGGLMDPSYIDQPWTMGKVGSVLAHLVIPVIVIGTSGTAAMIRRLRANLLDELQKQYVVTGRAKGLDERRLLIKYPLRMSLNPFIADIGNLLPGLISGSVIVSVVLNLPTIGPVLLDSLASQDLYLAGFILLFVSILTVLGMLLSDILLAILDPRIRLGGGTSA